MFDVVTSIVNSFFDETVVKRVRKWLTPGGCLVFDARNPENARAKFRQGNRRTWREEPL
jgi:hypothetical protein